MILAGQIQYGATYLLRLIDALGCRYVEQIDLSGPHLTVNAHFDLWLLVILRAMGTKFRYNVTGTSGANVGN